MAKAKKKKTPPVLTLDAFSTIIFQASQCVGQEEFKNPFEQHMSVCGTTLDLSMAAMNFMLKNTPDKEENKALVGAFLSSFLDSFLEMIKKSKLDSMVIENIELSNELYMERFDTICPPDLVLSQDGPKSFPTDIWLGRP